MKFTYCPTCGAKAVPREIGDEGLVSFCESCSKPLFDYFSTCVLSVVRNECGEIALIRQSYGDTTRYVGVAGFMKCRETAEQAAVREITEEIGITPERVRYVMSAVVEAKDQLMLCFVADAKKSELTCSSEVAEACWFAPEEAAKIVRQGSIIHRLVEAVIAEDKHE